MAIPKKGSRRIVVDGAAYLWRIRRKATPSQVDYGNGSLHLAVAAEHGGTTLVVVTNRPHPHDIFPRPAVAVTPADVREWILAALALGWQPENRGAPFCATVEGGVLIQTPKS